MAARDSHTYGHTLANGDRVANGRANLDTNIDAMANRYTDAGDPNVNPLANGYANGSNRSSANGQQ